MGWEIAEGPELESEWFNFDALNFDADHPARADAGHVLRRPARRAPRAAHAHEPRCRCARCSSASCRSTCSRPAASTAPTSSTRRTCPCSRSSRASPSTRASRWRTCKGTLDHFAKVDLRRRGARSACARTTSPSPSRRAELDFWHPTFKGGARWIEWGGCGMVNPNVLRAAGIDPEVYSGLRVRHGHRADAHVPQRRAGHARHGRGRRPLQRSSSGWWSDARPADRGSREYVDSCRRTPTPEDVHAALVRSASRRRTCTRFELQRPDRRGRGARVRRGAAVQRQDHPLVPGARRARRRDRGRRRRRRARHRLRRAQLLRRRQGRRDAARAPCCPARSRSPRARPTATSPTA